MSISAGSAATADDFVSTSAGAGDSGKVAKLDSSGKHDRSFLPLVVETTTGTTHSLTTVAGQRVIVWAKGTVALGGGSANPTVSLKYNGVTKDSITTQNIASTNSDSFSLMYTEIPGAGTHDITVENSAASLNDVLIIVMKI